MPKVTLFVDVGFAGASYVLNDASSVLPPGIENEVSSIKIENANPEDFSVFWESRGYDGGDDSLWIQGNGQIENLHVLVRPHGNNRWGDLISGVSFQSAPLGSSENRTILYSGRRDYLDGSKGIRELDDRNPSWGR